MVFAVLYGMEASIATRGSWQGVQSSSLQEATQKSSRIRAARFGRGTAQGAHLGLQYRRRLKLAAPVQCAVDDVKPAQPDDQGAVSPDTKSGVNAVFSANAKVSPESSSMIEKAAAYKQQKENQSAPKSAAMSALERAKAYKANQSSGSVKKLGLESKVSSQPLEAPGKLPTVEIVRGKAPLQSSRTFEEISSSDDRILKGVQAGAVPSAVIRRESSELLATWSTENDLRPDLGYTEAASVQSFVSTSLQQAQDPLVMQSPGGSESTPSLSAMLPENDYQQQQSEMMAALNGQRERAGSEPFPESAPQVLDVGVSQSKTSSSLEVEIITRDGIVRRKVSDSKAASEKVQAFKSQAISSKDFIGLDFSDKKDSRATPAGLYAAMDMPRGPLPEVEIITREASAAEGGASSLESGEEAYKPKVATWGVFPRPRDISRTYGGGRTIRPGEPLETTEEKEARERKTREMLEQYRRLVGIDLDPTVKAECDAAMEAGLALMDVGRLRDAFEKFDMVTSKTVFKSVLHGKAMLQKAVCLDSMARSQDARELYERLVGHPDGSVRKRARQLLFGFQAAENLRVRGEDSYDSSVYRKYFDSLTGDFNNAYKASEDEGDERLLWEAFPYLLLLLMPLLLVLAAAMSRASSG